MLLSYQTDTSSHYLYMLRIDALALNLASNPEEGSVANLIKPLRS